MEKFGKAYKLGSRKTIGSLFKEGKQLRSYPFTVYMHEFNNSENVPFQLVFSAPKRAFKRAHDRNYIKRLMRETFRKKKLILEDELTKQQKQLALFVIYTPRELPKYADLLHQTEKLLVKITAAIAHENETIQR
jgi:ribonuclease P protein component